MSSEHTIVNAPNGYTVYVPNGYTVVTYPTNPRISELIQTALETNITRGTD